MRDGTIVTNLKGRNVALKYLIEFISFLQFLLDLLSFSIFWFILGEHDLLKIIHFQIENKKLILIIIIFRTLVRCFEL